MIRLGNEEILVGVVAVDAVEEDEVLDAPEVVDGAALVDNETLVGDETIMEEGDTDSMDNESDE